MPTDTIGNVSLRLTEAELIDARAYQLVGQLEEEHE